MNSVFHTGTPGNKFHINMENFVLVIEMDEHNSTSAYELKIHFNDKSNSSVFIAPSVIATSCSPNDTQNLHGAAYTKFWMVIRSVNKTSEMTTLQLYRENKLVYNLSESSENSNCNVLKGEKIEYGLAELISKSNNSGLVKLLYVTPYQSISNTGNFINFLHCIFRIVLHTEFLYDNE